MNEKILESLFSKQRTRGSTTKISYLLVEDHRQQLVAYDISNGWTELKEKLCGYVFLDHTSIYPRFKRIEAATQHEETN